MAPRVLVLPYPAQGHINPALAFATHLASMSLSVTVLITTDLINKATVSSSSSASISIASISDGKESVEGTETFEAYINRFTAVLSANLAEFIDHNPAKLLVYDSSMPWAMEVARARGLLCAPFFTMSAAVSAIFYHLKNGGLKYPYEECEEVRLPSLPCLGGKDLPSLSFAMDPNQTILKLVCGQFSNLEKADWIFINTFDMLEREIVEWMASKWPIKTIGPTILLNQKDDNNNHTTINLFEPQHDTITQWLDSKETASVVYVSLGSTAILRKPPMEEFAHGLIASNRHFLWVVRASEADKLPRDFDLGEKGLVVTWCDQPAVLAHRAVACFVSHCGWNSTLEAVGHGVPVVAVPQWVDQTTDAKFVEDVWGIGVVMRGCEREEIAECIEGVVGGERGAEMRRKACELKKLAEEAVACGGTSASNVQQFVEELLCR